MITELSRTSSGPSKIIRSRDWHNMTTHGVLFNAVLSVEFIAYYSTVCLRAVSRVRTQCNFQTFWMKSSWAHTRKALTMQAVTRVWINIENVPLTTRLCDRIRIELHIWMVRKDERVAANAPDNLQTKPDNNARQTASLQMIRARVNRTFVGCSLKKIQPI